MPRRGVFEAMVNITKSEVDEQILNAEPNQIKPNLIRPERSDTK